MTKLELKSSHEVIDTVDVADVESIFYCKPTDPDILTVLMKDGKRLYCDEVCPVDPIQEVPCNHCQGYNDKEKCDELVFGYKCPVVKKPVKENLEEAAKKWLNPKLDKSYANYGETKMMELTHFDGYNMLDAIEFGAEWCKKHQAGKDVLDAIEKELTRRMLEDYNEGAEEDEIAQGCMASLIMFVRQMKEE